MSLTPVPLIAGVTVSAVYQAFATTPPYPPSGTAAVLGVDYAVSTVTGEIEVLRNFPYGGWMAFTFHDAGGTIAGAPEFPAFSGVLTGDLTGITSDTDPRDVAWRLSASSTSHYQAAGSTHDYVVTYNASQSNFNIAVGSDGSFSSRNPKNAKLLLKLDITLTSPTKWGGFEGCFEDTE